MLGLVVCAIGRPMGYAAISSLVARRMEWGSWSLKHPKLEGAQFPRSSFLRRRPGELGGILVDGRSNAEPSTGSLSFDESVEVASCRCSEPVKKSYKRME